MKKSFSLNITTLSYNVNKLQTMQFFKPYSLIIFKTILISKVLSHSIKNILLEFPLSKRIYAHVGFMKIRNAIGFILLKIHRSIKFTVVFQCK